MEDNNKNPAENDSLQNETKIDIKGDLEKVAEAAKREKAEGKDNFEGFMEIGGNTSGPNA